MSDIKPLVGLGHPPPANPRGIRFLPFLRDINIIPRDPLDYSLPPEIASVLQDGKAPFHHIYTQSVKLERQIFDSGGARLNWVLEEFMTSFDEDPSMALLPYSSKHC
jgi:hypothetical protein